MEENTELLNKYTTNVIKTSKPDEWGKITVEILKDGVKIGEYNRNYGSLYKTFYPFELNNKEYALFSPEYTCTRIMSLPDCKDIGGEEPNSFGFCPTGYAVPLLSHQGEAAYTTDKRPYNPRHDPERWASKVKEGDYFHYYYPNHEKGETKLLEEYNLACKKGDDEFDARLKRNPHRDVPANFGFVCGCVWGDDSSWKVQYLDLSQADKGILVREERMGYVELIGGSESLSRSIYVDSWTPEYQYITIAVAKRFNLQTKEWDKE